MIPGSSASCLRAWMKLKKFGCTRLSSPRGLRNFRLALAGFSFKSRDVKAPPVFILIVCFVSLALADDFKTIKGKEYKNATVSRVEPDGIVLRNFRLALAGFS